MTNNWDLPVAFYFQVRFDTEEIAFKEVSGLNTEMELETISEGGENTYQHVLPKQIKHGNLILKRAQLPIDCSFIGWIKSILESNFSNPIKYKDLVICLLNSDGAPAYTWNCEKVFPVKWETDSLDAEKNTILIETVEFAYSSLKRQ